jgi:hypothetical protein
MLRSLAAAALALGAILAAVIVATNLAGADNPPAAGPATAAAEAKLPEGAVPSPVKFVMRRIGNFRSEALGVADFSKDGKLDVVAGPIWYEAPDWKPHKFRTLRGSVDQAGKGYYDDFANLPLDVDGDGLLDVITCCWFATRTDWYRNTGPDGGDWPAAVVDTGPNCEAGDLVDIDGDGKANEILPDVPDTHWLERGKGKDGKPTLIRHDVSAHQSPYGIGVGDVNGDGRPDILRPDVWYEAPADPRTGKWIPHPIALGGTQEGKADHTPQILVYDVDGDGVPDIVTSLAHGYGIWWYQQIRGEAGKESTWKRHLIDKSWSQAHSLVLADINGDGLLDLVTGKRFQAHNGGDPGENEPLGVYWYELQRKPEVKWIKHVLSYNEGIGSGVNLVVVDLDGDGDLDIVVTGKWGGPVWFENQTKSPKGKGVGSRE